MKYCDLLDWIRAKWLEIDKKIFPVSKKLRRDPWGFRQQGWSTPTESGINDGERRLFDISSALTSDVRVWTAEIETVIDTATPRRRLNSFEDRSLLRSCERAQLLAFARLQSLV